MCMCGYMTYYFTTGSTTLTEIIIGDNRFGDDAMPLMCKGLQHISKLAELNIRKVGLTTKGNNKSSRVQTNFLCHYIYRIMFTP